MLSNLVFDDQASIRLLPQRRKEFLESEDKTKFTYKTGSKLNISDEFRRTRDLAGDAIELLTYVGGLSSKQLPTKRFMVCFSEVDLEVFLTALLLGGQHAKQKQIRLLYQGAQEKYLKLKREADEMVEEKKQRNKEQKEKIENAEKQVNDLAKKINLRGIPIELNPYRVALASIAIRVALDAIEDFYAIALTQRVKPTDYEYRHAYKESFKKIADDLRLWLHAVTQEVDHAAQQSKS